MAITAAPFALKNLGLDAEPLRQAVASLVPSTGGVVQLGDLTVTQTGTPSLGVSVSAGRAWMPGTNTANISGKDYSTQGQYFCINDAPFTVNLATADATNPRIDLIYIGATDTQYGGATNVIKIDKVTGVPASTPQVPALPANSIPLGQVAVAANATSITNANITNVSVSFNYRNAEFTSAMVSQPSGNGAFMGLFTVDPAKTYGNTFAHAHPTSAGFIVIDEPGMYLISCNYQPQAAYSNSHCWGIHGTQGTILSVKGGSYGSTQTSVTTQVSCVVGDTIQFGWTGDVTCNVTSRVRITKMRG